MPIDMRRPPRLDLPDWTGAVEEELRAQVAPARSRRWTPAVPGRWTRLLRSAARPVAHGMAGLAAVAVALAFTVPSWQPVATTDVHLSAALSPLEENLTNVASSLSDIPLLSVDASPGQEGIHAPIGNDLPPAPGLQAFLIYEDLSAIRPPSDIQTGDEELTGTPHSTARAVPTPAGGGAATAALRQPVLR